VGILDDPEEMVALADYYYPASSGAFNRIYRILGSRPIYLHIVLTI